MGPTALFKKRSSSLMLKRPKSFIKLHRRKVSGSNPDVEIEVPSTPATPTTPTTPASISTATTSPPRSSFQSSRKSSDTETHLSDESYRSALFARRCSTPNVYSNEEPEDIILPVPSITSAPSQEDVSTPTPQSNPYAPENPYGEPSPWDAESTVDSNREALFGNQQVQLDRAPEFTGDYDNREDDILAGRRESRGFGYSLEYGYEPTVEEEEEEEDVDHIKQELRFVKDETVSSTRNALRIASQAEETALGTVQRLAVQGERLANNEKNLNMSLNTQRNNEEKIRELKTLNRSMFAVTVKNPMKSRQRQEDRERRILDNHRSDREDRALTNAYGYASKAKTGWALKQTENEKRRSLDSSASLAERAKYQFEADDEDHEKEREIEGNLKQIGAVVGRLNRLGRVMGDEVGRQNETIQRSQLKSDRLEDKMALGTHRLTRIH